MSDCRVSTGPTFDLLGKSLTCTCLVFFTVLVGGIFILQRQQACGIQPTKQEARGGVVDQPDGDESAKFEGESGPLNPQAFQDRDKTELQQETVKTLRRLQSELRPDTKAINEQLKPAENKTKTAAIASMQSSAALHKKLANNRIELSELVPKVDSSEAALKKGNESCIEQIWLLEANGMIPKGSLISRGDEGQISRIRKTMEEVEDLREQALLDKG